MEFKGTNGWFLDKEGYLIDKNFDIIADFFITNQEDLANAKIASKAPEMLELINEFYLMCIQKTFPTEHELEYMAEKAEKLIKEATEL